MFLKGGAQLDLTFTLNLYLYTLKISFIRNLPKNEGDLEEKNFGI